jgi:hypothetical protein
VTCEHVRLPGGGTAIVCGPRRSHDRCRCGRIATLACDWKMPKGTTVRKTGTCDKPLCERCTVSPAPDKDLCPTHAEAFEAWRSRREEAARLKSAHEEGKRSHG